MIVALANIYGVEAECEAKYAKIYASKASASQQDVSEGAAGSNPTRKAKKRILLVYAIFLP